MLEHLVEFTAWPILTGILVGYVANRIMSGEGKGYEPHYGNHWQLCGYLHQPLAKHRTVG